MRSDVRMEADREKEKKKERKKREKREKEAADFQRCSFCLLTDSSSNCAVAQRSSLSMQESFLSPFLSVMWFHQVAISQSSNFSE